MLRVERLGVIIKPNYETLFERLQTFNPGVYYDERRDVVHIFPRVQCSYSPYTAKIMWYVADLSNGVENLKKPKRVKDYPIFGPSEVYHWAGTEDPRVVKARITNDDYLIMTYTAVETFHPLRHRVGVAYVKAEDIESLKPSVAFSPLGVIEYINDKDAFYFITKDGQVYYIHRPAGVFARACMWVSELEKSKIHDMESLKDLLKMKDPKVFVKARFWWENDKIGAGAPPLATDFGYLWIYHGVQYFGVGRIYRAGVFLTDLREPLKVIARLPEPLLEPKEPYEKWLDVPYVVFPTGAFIRDDFLYIIYGACDTVIAAARVRLDELLSELDKYHEEDIS